MTLLQDITKLEKLALLDYCLLRQDSCTRNSAEPLAVAQLDLLTSNCFRQLNAAGWYLVVVLPAQTTQAEYDSIIKTLRADDLCFIQLVINTKSSNTAYARNFDRSLALLALQLISNYEPSDFLFVAGQAHQNGLRYELKQAEKSKGANSVSGHKFPTLTTVTSFVELARILNQPLNSIEEAASPAKSRPVRSHPSSINPPNNDSDLCLTAYRTRKGVSMPIVTAPTSRQWINETSGRFAQRCLPLMIANQAGWWILNDQPIRVTWDGGIDASNLKVEYLKPALQSMVASHFGYGILTWEIPYLFRTPPGYNLVVRGPTNWCKDGVVALDGVIETDWAEATFTMNWKVTRPNCPIIFEAGEPICMFFPQQRGELEKFQPEIRDIETEPTLNYGYQRWSSSRLNFVTKKKVPGSLEAKQGWEKHYFQGTAPSGTVAPVHQSKLALRDCVDHSIAKD